MSSNRPGINRAIQIERRRLLIDATMTAISQHGLSKLTLAKIADIAGLSAGSVNFHFSSKEALLLETLTFLAREFEQRIDQALAASDSHPAQRLLALFDASVDPEITEPRKMAVWFAFTAEARGREDYQRICGSQDKKIFAITLKLCDEIIHLGGNSDFMSPRAMANAVQGLIDEIWQEVLYTGDDFDREDSRTMYLAYLASVFPWCYEAPELPRTREERLSPEAGTLKVVRAQAQHLPALGDLFDQYRQFSEQPPDQRLARKFMGDNIRHKRSVVLLALDKQKAILGFVQLYPGWCSVAAAPLWTLYDLFVAGSTRQRGVGRALMQAAEKQARRSRACRIDLDTRIDNFTAQALFEDLGYQRDSDYYSYSLPL